MKYIVLLLFAHTATLMPTDRFIAQCKAYFDQPYIHAQLTDVPHFASTKTETKREITYKKAPILFERHPELAEHIAYINLGTLPTPVEQLEQLNAKMHKNIWIKRDNLTAKIKGNGRKLFGGNKVRKLEFLLADALQHNYRTVMTFGCAGSNHSLATASYAHELGLECICMLMPQPASDIVRRNLMLHQTVNSTLHMNPTEELREVGAFYTCLRHAQKHEQYPYIIPTGGSCPLGILGIVNAAYELHEQISSGQMPEPDYIYVPVGSMGTISGLTLGTKLLGMKTKVIGIAVEPEETSGMFAQNVLTLAKQTYKLLRRHSSTMPKIRLTLDDIQVKMSYCGAAYGQKTAQSTKATKLMLAQENITLDPTYSAKACAGMLDQCAQHSSDDVILFWYTFDGSDFHDALRHLDYKALPPALHTYFQ